MRFCPFCARENPGDVRDCVHCGKRLPTLRKVPARPQRPTKLTPRSLPELDARAILGSAAPPTKSAAPLEAGGREEALHTPPPPPRPTRPPLTSVPLAGNGNHKPPPAADVDVAGEPAADTDPALIGPPVLEANTALVRAPEVALVRAPHEESQGMVLHEELRLPPGQAPLSSDDTLAALLPNSALPPIPARPESPGLLGAAMYLMPVAQGVMRRKQAERVLAAQVVDDQGRLDALLGELGRAARQAEIEAPQLDEELVGLKEREAARRDAEGRMADCDRRIAEEEERRRKQRAEHEAELEKRELELKLLDNELRQKSDAQRICREEQERVAARIAEAEKRAQAVAAKPEEGARTETTGAETSGAEAARRREVADARAQATALLPLRERLDAELAKLEAPVTEYAERVSQERARLQELREAGVAAAKAHETTLAEARSERQRAVGDREKAERELSQRFVTFGTVLNLDRVEHPSLVPLFGRIDDLRSGIGARERTIARLESERHLYDRSAVKRGLVLVGGGAAALLLALVVALVTFVR